MDSKRLGLLYDPKISCETGFVVQVMPQMTAFGYSVLDLCFSVQRQTITHRHIYRQWEPYKSPRVLKILTIKIITLRAMKGKACHLFFSQLDCCFDKSHKSTRTQELHKLLGLAPQTHSHPTRPQHTFTLKYAKWQVLSHSKLCGGKKSLRETELTFHQP